MTPLKTKPSDEMVRRAQLTRFGYRQTGLQAGAVNLEAAWPLLRTDFVDPPELADVSPETRTLLQQYAEQRSRIDDLLERCDAVHAEILQRGAEPQLVEVYAEARDAYEDAVEAFGGLRAAVAAALSKAPAP